MHRHHRRERPRAEALTKQCFSEVINPNRGFGLRRNTCFADLDKASYAGTAGPAIPDPLTRLLEGSESCPAGPQKGQLSGVPIVRPCTLTRLEPSQIHRVIG